MFKPELPRETANPPTLSERVCVHDVDFMTETDRVRGSVMMSAGHSMFNSLLF